MTPETKVGHGSSQDYERLNGGLKNFWPFGCFIRSITELIYSATVTRRRLEPEGHRIRTKGLC